MHEVIRKIGVIFGIVYGINFIPNFLTGSYHKIMVSNCWNERLSLLEPYVRGNTNRQQKPTESEWVDTRNNLDDRYFYPPQVEDSIIHKVNLLEDEVKVHEVKANKHLLNTCFYGYFN